MIIKLNNKKHMQRGHIIIDTTSEQHYNRKAKVKALQNTLKLQKHIRTTT